MSRTFRDNPVHYTVSTAVRKKLELSRQMAAKVPTRQMRCPYCGYLVRIIPMTQTEVVYVKCQKCKFDGPLSPAYFRRMKRQTPVIRLREEAERHYIR